MCGLAGIFLDDPGAVADPAQAGTMGAALAHRGPDEAGLWHEGPFAVAHRRLRVLDLSPRGRQPMQSACGRHVLAYNGEVYNFAALREELAAGGAQFHSTCDTEVLLAALARWGEAALDRLIGMFAFAWFDRAERRLTLVRDRLGIKPLYLARLPGGVAFASELGALRAGGFLGGGPDPAALDAYFAHLYIPAPDTAYRGVTQLSPGEVVRVERGRVATRRWWTLARDIDPAWTLDSAAERYLDLLEDSVRLRRVSDVPVGAFLSGGLDSSTVVAVMAGQGGPPVRTFSIGFDDAQMNELRFAREAAGHLGTEHHEEMLHPDMVALLPRLVRHFGAPFADSSALPTWLVSQVARGSVTVALTGDGGDELFAGYAWTRMAMAVARYRRVPAPLRRALDPLWAAVPPGGRAAALGRFHRDAALPPVEAFRRRHTCLDPATRRALLAPCGAPAAPDRFRAHWEAVPGLGEGDRMLHTDTAMYLPDDVLTKVDRMSMAHALEARVPLLDHRLVEFAATVPFHLKLSGGTTKRLAKHAARRLLPPALLRQRKQGFSVPVHAWFRGALRAHFEEAVLAPGARVAACVDTRVARALFEAHVAGRARWGHALWALLVLEHHLRETA
jgi:asparagine synthase (glutamine-hydrolysing)